MNRPLQKVFSIFLVISALNSWFVHNILFKNIDLFYENCFTFKFLSINLTEYAFSRRMNFRMNNLFFKQLDKQIERSGYLYRSLHVSYFLIPGMRMWKSIWYLDEQRVNLKRDIYKIYIYLRYYDFHVLNADTKFIRSYSRKFTNRVIGTVLTCKRITPNLLK